MNKTEEDKKILVGAYCRVSTLEQKNNSTIKNQITGINNFLKINKQYKIYDYYLDDGVSGTVPLNKRPQGKRLLQDIKEGMLDQVLIYKTSRLGRSLKVLLKAVESLLESNTSFMSITEPYNTSTPSGKMMFQILSAFIEYDWNNIIETTREGRERAISEGKWVDGFPPYGYIVDKKTGKLIIYEIEAKIVIRIYELCVVHQLSCPKIADILNKEGVPPYTEGKNKKVYRKNVRGKTITNAKFWHSARVLNIIKDPVYKGKKELGKTSKDRKIRILEVDPVVSEEVWDKAQKVLRSNMIEATRNKKRNYVLRGLISCGKCNRNYSGFDSHGYLYYGCNGYRKFNSKRPEKCFNKNIRAEVLEKTIWEDVKKFIKNPHEIRRFLMEKQEKLTRVNFNAEIEKEKVDYKRIEKDMDTLLEMNISEDSLAKKRLEKKLNKLNKEAEKSQERLDQLKRLQQDSESKVKKISEIEKKLKQFTTLIDEPTPAQKEKFMKLVVDKVIVYPQDDKNKTRSVEIFYKFNKDACFITKLDRTA